MVVAFFRLHILKSFRRKTLYKDIGTYCSYIIRNSFYLILFPQILSDGVFFVCVLSRFMTQSQLCRLF